jgi:integrase/recombinase XerD
MPISAVTSVQSEAPSFNPKNERIKREYFGYQKEARGKAAGSVDAMRKALSRYELYTGLKDFATFNRDQAVGFKKHLAKLPTARGSGTLSTSTMAATIYALKEFFAWLGWQRGYRGRIRVTDVEFLNLSDNELRSVKEPAFRPVPTMEQIRAVIAAMPATTAIEKRDRALVTMAILTGARDSALATLRLKHVDLDRKLVMQDPREVRTKRRNRIDTFLVPLGDDLEQIVTEWVLHLRQEGLFGDDDPVFPRTSVRADADAGFVADGIEAVFWENTQPIRDIFRAAFEAAGLLYFPPHSFRHALVKFAERNAPTIEHFKAFSQNIGHKHVNTTLTSYGGIERNRQGELIRSNEWSRDKDRNDSRNLALFDAFMRMVKGTTEDDSGNA